MVPTRITRSLTKIAEPVKALVAVSSFCWASATAAGSSLTPFLTPGIDVLGIGVFDGAANDVSTVGDGDAAGLLSELEPFPNVNT